MFSTFDVVVDNPKPARRSAMFIIREACASARSISEQRGYAENPYQVVEK